MQIPTAQLFDNPINASVSVKGKHEITMSGGIMCLIRYVSYCTVGIYHHGVAGKQVTYDEIIRALGDTDSVTFQGINTDYQITFNR